MSDTTTNQTGEVDLRQRSEHAASTARDQAASVAGTAQSQLHDIKEEAATQVRAVADDAKIQTQRLVEDTRRELSRQAEDQTARLAGGVRDVSRQLRGLLEGGQAPEGVVRDVTAQAAQAASHFADTLEQRRPEELLEEVRAAARRRPGLFLLGALGVGIVAARVFKAADTGRLVDSAKSAAAGEEPEAPETYGSLPGSADALGSGSATPAPGAPQSLPADQAFAASVPTQAMRP